ncbi:DUF2958 domain-containing protein [Algibacter sp. R77976]|uniref:DUF2958 domain-containing protein n=1 Tax=Algibacter sp. R77976 TaxID=3093873 RepID=UPI0037CBD2DA
MKLMTKALEKRFVQVGDQSEKENPTFIAKFFDPVGSATWYATEYDPHTNICNGYVTGLAFDEWGSFSITELESIVRPFGLGIERDIHFNEISYQDLVPQKSRKRKVELQGLKVSKTQENDQER